MAVITIDSGPEDAINRLVRSSSWVKRWAVELGWWFEWWMLLVCRRETRE